MTAQRNFCLGNSLFIVDEGFYRDVMLLDL